MMPEVPWNIQGIDPETRADAEECARRAGMSVGEWLNEMVRRSGGPSAPGATHIAGSPSYGQHGAYYGGQQNWPGETPFRRDAAPQTAPRPLATSLHHIDSRIDDIAAQLQNLTRMRSETAIPTQDAARQSDPDTRDAGMRNIENTLKNIVDLIEATDTRTSQSLQEMRAQGDALKAGHESAHSQQATTQQPDSAAPRTRFEARRDRRRQLRSGIQPDLASNSAGSVPPGEPGTDFVSLARSLEAALEKSNASTPLVTSSDIDALREDVRALATRVADTPAGAGTDKDTWQALQTKLEQISAEVNSTGRNLGGIANIDQKINALFDQLEQTRQSMADANHMTASEAAQIALREAAGHAGEVPGSDSGLQSLQTQLEQISGQLNSSFDVSAALADIDQKIAVLGDQFLQAQQNAPAAAAAPSDTGQLADIEHKIGLLFEHLQQTQQMPAEEQSRIAGEAAQLAVRDATQEAVRAAAEHVASYLPDKIAGNETELIRVLDAKLDDIIARSAQADQQTQSTLHAVQDSLHAILDRLTYVDTSTPAYLPQHAATGTDEATAAQPVMRGPGSGTGPAPMDQPAADSRSGELAIGATRSGNTEFAEVTEIGAAPRPAPDDKTSPKAPAEDKESARPLEPGSGQPNMPQPDENTAEAHQPDDTAPAAHEPEPDTASGPSLSTASTNEELLAAARRAARSAASSGTDKKAEKKGLFSRLSRNKKARAKPASSSAPKPKKTSNPADSAKPTSGDKIFGLPRKPLLLTSLAVLLFVGSMKIYEIINADSNATGPATAPAIDLGAESNMQDNADNEVPGTSLAEPGTPEDGAANNATPPAIDGGPAPRMSPLSNEQSAIPSNRQADVTGSLPQNPSTGPSATATPETMAAPASNNAEVEMPPEGVGSEPLRRAAAAGNATAQFEVAARLAEGRGVSADPALAATWYQRAAAQGLASAQYRLGSMYEKGHGVSSDRNAARIWYQRAAELGNRKAMHNLAVLYADGIEGEPDMAGAARWFRKAADFGLNDSQFNLGILYARGMGVPRNMAEAYKWLAIAAANGDVDAESRRDAIAQQLDQQTLAAAKLAVQTWRAEPLVAEANTVRLPADGWGEAAPAPSQYELPGRDIIRNAQKLLAATGFNPGPADGIWGPRTQDAITQFEKSQNRPGTGQLTPDLLRTLQQVAG